MEITKYAPVIIPTLNRYEHFVRCVESLLKCTHADKTDLIIGLDFPPSEKYEAGYRKIEKYLNELIGFSQIVILKRDVNLGAVKNIDELIAYVSEHYDRYIFTEDDNEFSPNFLDYVNKGLCLYENHPNIFAICGYNYPIDLQGYSGNYYYSHEMAAWGYGTWTEKYNKVKKLVDSPSYLYDYYKKNSFFYYTKDNCRPMRYALYLGKGFMGDVFITSYLHANNVYNVHPKISLVRNWGHDGSGVNCNKNSSDVYTNQQIQGKKTFEFEQLKKIELDDYVYKQYLSFLNFSFKEKVKCFILFVLLRTFIKFNR